ncbi:MAG: MBOAT family O-acyltransferase [Porcipelethomonas sp.]
MVFSSIVFIYFFLPAVLLVYYAAPRKLKNLILLVSGLFFYAWGEPVYVFVMLLSTVVDYTAGRIIAGYDDKKAVRRAALICSVVINIGLLGVFKYSGFIAGIFGFSMHELPLPVGISFYTFQSMSYTIDLYMRRIKVQKNFISFASYVSMFPQIVAGPIVRYEDIQKEIDSRRVNIYLLGEGAGIFIKGLAKKALLANNIGLLWSEVKEMDFGSISAATAWLGILAFTFQIYYDFSGYSDMAVGLGKMLGFNFPENFRYPYISRSISEFWRRWHITLGSWFRSYVYIPLGGNRKGRLKTLRNLLIVWALTGLWHGASWNFILWGIYFGVIIITERVWLGKKLEKANPVISTAYSFVLVVLGWVLFDTETLGSAVEFYKAMFCGNGRFIDSFAIYELKTYFIVFVLCIFGAGKCFSRIIERCNRSLTGAKVIENAAPVVQAFLLLLCTAFLVNAGYNPFMYFRF